MQSLQLKQALYKCALLICILPPPPWFSPTGFRIAAVDGNCIWNAVCYLNTRHFYRQSALWNGWRQARTRPASLSALIKNPHGHLEEPGSVSLWIEQAAVTLKAKENTARPLLWSHGQLSWWISRRNPEKVMAGGASSTSADGLWERSKISCRFPLKIPQNTQQNNCTADKPRIDLLARSLITVVIDQNNLSWSK